MICGRHHYDFKPRRKKSHTKLLINYKNLESLYDCRRNPPSAFLGRPLPRPDEPPLAPAALPFLLPLLPSPVDGVEGVPVHVHMLKIQTGTGKGSAVQLYIH